MKNKIIKSVIALSVVASTAAFAQTPQAPAPFPQGTFLSAAYGGTLPEGLVVFNWMITQTTTKHMTIGQNKDQKQRVTLINPILRMGLANGYGFRIVAPNPIVKNTTSGETMSSTIANTQIILEKTITSQRNGDFMTINIEAGVGAPTSKNQSGWGYKLGSRASWINAPHALNFSVLGHWWTKDDNYKEGALYQASARYGYAINSSFDVITELVYDKQEAHTRSGVKMTQMNGISKMGASETLYATLGLTWKAKFATITLGAGLPVYDKYKGIVQNGVYRDTNKDAKAGVKYGTYFVIPIAKPKN